MKKLIFVLLFVASFAYSEGNEAAHGGGKEATSLYESKGFIIDSGPSEQRDQLKKVLDVLVKAAKYLKNSTANPLAQTYEKLEKSIRLSHYMIESENAPEGDGLFAKTMVDQNERNENKRFSSITYIYPFFFSTKLDFYKRRAVLTHEAIHRIYPNYSEEQVEDDKRTIYEKLEEENEMENSSSIRIFNDYQTVIRVNIIGYGSSYSGTDLSCQGAIMNVARKGNAFCKLHFGEFAEPIQPVFDPSCKVVKRESHAWLWTKYYTNAYLTGECTQKH